MARRLFTVEDTFAIASRGIIAIPGIIPVSEERFKIGDPILLKRPNGSELETVIAGLEYCSPKLHPDIPVLLKLSKDDVPIGTEVWSIDAD